ncbi:hypothetical protein Cgig2_022315 [Carnegiea gigantea]|uniref:Uncharacterized protein n=1 Tax=Carnegiea gigantea TaxID=171969 RepID=A0A9Q1GTJ9_9CARY|nr:hypothetical protein Cgig2_022315 [Carnegiea gigantea]
MPWSSTVTDLVVPLEYMKLQGYSLRHFHETRMARRLDSIEATMKNNYQIEREEIKKIVHTGSFSTEASIATAGTTLVIGFVFLSLLFARYALGWRGGKWYANRKFKREQMKLLGQIKPRRWRLQFIRTPNFQFIRIPLIRNNSSKSAVERSRSSAKREISP